MYPIVRLFVFILIAIIYCAGTHSRGGWRGHVASAQATCQFSLSALDQSVPPAGGSGSVSFTTADAQCAWMARSTASWITITTATTGVGSGMINFSVAPSAGARSGTIIVAGKVFTVRQEFNPCAAPRISTYRDFFRLWEIPENFSTRISTATALKTLSSIPIFQDRRGSQFRLESMVQPAVFGADRDRSRT